MSEKRNTRGLQGNSVVVIGAEHQGKSYFVKNNLIGKAAVVWDPKNEYHDLECTTYSPGRTPSLEQLEKYVKYVIGLDGSIPVIEEASIFFSTTGKGTQNFINFMQGRYHSLTTPVPIFHNISEVPHFIYKRADWFVLFPTGETEAEINDKGFRGTRLAEAFLSKLAKPRQPLIFRKIPLA